MANMLSGNMLSGEPLMMAHRVQLLCRPSNVRHLQQHIASIAFLQQHKASIAFPCQAYPYTCPMQGAFAVLRQTSRLCLQ